GFAAGIGAVIGLPACALAGLLGARIPAAAFAPGFGCGAGMPVVLVGIVVAVRVLLEPALAGRIRIAVAAAALALPRLATLTPLAWRRCLETLAATRWFKGR